MWGAWRESTPRIEQASGLTRGKPLLWVTTATSESLERGSGYTRSGLRYQPATPLHSGDSKNEEEIEGPNRDSSVGVSPHSTWVSEYWDMDEMYGGTRGLRRFSGKVGTIELEDFMQEFECWCDRESLKNKKDFTPFLAWKMLFNHLEGAPMDDWRDFAKQHAKEIETWRDFWSPDYVPLTLHGIEARIEEAKRKEKDGESSSSTGSESFKGEMPKFNPMVEFFKVLAKSYLGVRVDKLKSLQDFQRKTGESLCEVYAHMK